MNMDSSAVLIAAMPATGHVVPLTHVAKALVDRGIKVRFLAGTEFESTVTAVGAEFVALPLEADAKAAAERQAGTPARPWSPVVKLRHDLQAIFVDAIPAQVQAIRTALDASPTDVLIADPMFLGAFCLERQPRAVQVFAYGVMPVPHSGPGVPPFGVALRPGRGFLGRARDRALTRFIQRQIFKPVQSAAEAAVSSVGGSAPPKFFLDWSSDADRYFQTGPAGLEYPRPAGVLYEFVGAVPPPATGSAMPTWWPTERDNKPVIFVTQGTVQNDRFDALIEPAIAALAGTGVSIIATTGSSENRPVRGSDHPDVTVVPFVPYADVLPHADLMITNGGFGGVQQALAHGVPLVVAGRTEDKAEVATRVDVSGAGISLSTDRPSHRALRRAAESVLRDGRYRRAAQRLAAQSRSSGLESLINSVVVAHGGQAARYQAAPFPLEPHSQINPTGEDLGD